MNRSTQTTRGNSMSVQIKRPFPFAALPLVDAERLQELGILTLMSCWFWPASIFFFPYMLRIFTGLLTAVTLNCHPLSIPADPLVLRNGSTCLAKLDLAGQSSTADCTNMLGCALL
ncbi:unnamed protein product [Dibothriocephalus latus]|uniref:Uncharacterized protein n=1 Tax=Dibothriocephalus latus TaxID=60516 RepID=A0A3P6UAI1_DIBLA|nr:unnamed protein product [Dibothriocephalus latus]